VIGYFQDADRTVNFSALVVSIVYRLHYAVITSITVETTVTKLIVLPSINLKVCVC